MLKDWPEIKSWKKLERYCKRTKTKCYIWDIRSGLACAWCYIKISWKDKKGPRGPVIDSIFTNRGVKWIGIIPFFYKKVICRRCYEKKKKQTLILLSKFFIFFIVFGILLFLINEFLVKR